MPVAKAFARELGSVLVLVHAVEREPPRAVHGDAHLRSREAAEAYLEQERKLCDSEGLRAEVHVVAPGESDIAQVIVGLADEFDTDVVAMCAHGRHSLRDRSLGPIAQRALRGGGPPIMLRTAGAAPDRPVEIRHVLLPVDFRHELEIALQTVATLASGFGASVTLLHAVDAGSTGLPARMLPNTSLELSRLALEDARRRIAMLAMRFQERNIVSDGVVSTQEPDDAIIDEAKRRNTDLIVLVSHGRGGVTAWYERSVGRRIIQEPGLNLLLLRQPRLIDAR